MVMRLQENDIYVREENKNDVDAVDNINILAFNRTAEKELVRKLRDGETYVKEISLIADIDVNLASAILFKKSSNQLMTLLIKVSANIICNCTWNTYY